MFVCACERRRRSREAWQRKPDRSFRGGRSSAKLPISMVVSRRYSHHLRFLLEWNNGSRRKKVCFGRSFQRLRQRGGHLGLAAGSAVEVVCVAFFLRNVIKHAAAARPFFWESMILCMQWLERKAVAYYTVATRRYVDQASRLLHAMPSYS